MYLSHDVSDCVVTTVSRDLPSHARDEVVRFAAAAVRLDADKIGWLPFEFYDLVDRDGSLVSVSRNGDLVGFCGFRGPNKYGELKVIQTWVREDARQIENGRALMDRVAHLGWLRDASWLSCWVAQDLAAMRFWPAIGFVAVDYRLGRGDWVDVGRRRWLTQFARRIGIRGVTCQTTNDLLEF